MQLLTFINQECYKKRRQKSEGLKDKNMYVEVFCISWLNGAAKRSEFTMAAAAQLL